jgi:hypothetical protein
MYTFSDQHAHSTAHSNSNVHDYIHTYFVTNAYALV